MTKIALLVLYNHRYVKNIERIKNLYKGKFSYVYQLIPFYDGNDTSVIPVYGNSYYFQSFISQAYAQLRGKGFTHYFVVADDMILNPNINEDNLFGLLGVSTEDVYFPGFEPVQTGPWRTLWIRHILNFRIDQKGLEVSKVLPTREEAVAKFEKLGIPTGPMPLSYWFRRYEADVMWWKRWYHFIKELPLVAKRKLRYPIVKSYSDILLIPSADMGQFATYCGALAAANLFVEYAVPTAIALAVDKDRIKTGQDVQLKGMAIWDRDKLAALEGQYDMRLDKLQADYPSHILYIHPVKLSKWK